MKNNTQYATSKKKRKLFKPIIVAYILILS